MNNLGWSINRWVTCMGLAAVMAAAVIVPVSQAARHSNAMPGFAHLQDLNAMEARYQAGAKLLTPKPGYPSHLQDLNALAAQAQAHLRAAAGTQKGAHLANGFDWSKLGIGIGILGFALLLAATWFAVQARRRRVELATRTS